MAAVAGVGKATEAVLRDEEVGLSFFFFFFPLAVAGSRRERKGAGQCEGGRSWLARMPCAAALQRLSRVKLVLTAPVGVGGRGGLCSAARRETQPMRHLISTPPLHQNNSQHARLVRLVGEGGRGVCRGSDGRGLRLEGRHGRGRAPGGGEKKKAACVWEKQRASPPERPFRRERAPPPVRACCPLSVSSTSHPPPHTHAHRPLRHPPGTMEVERPLPPKDGMDLDGPGVSASAAHHAHADDAAAGGGDLYTHLKTLQRQLELTEIQVRAEWRVGGRGERGGKGTPARLFSFSFPMARSCKEKPGARPPWRAFGLVLPSPAGQAGDCTLPSCAHISSKGPDAALRAEARPAFESRRALFSFFP